MNERAQAKIPGPGILAARAVNVNEPGPRKTDALLVPPPRPHRSSRLDFGGCCAARRIGGGEEDQLASTRQELAALQDAHTALQATHSQQVLDIEHVCRGNIKSVRAALAAHSEAVVTALPGPEAGAEVSGRGGCDPLPVARPRFCGGFAEPSASAATLAAGLVGLVGEPRRDVDAAVREEHCNIAAGFGASDTPVTAPGGLEFTPRQVCSLDP